MINLRPPDPVPSGAVSPPDRQYWMVGTGLPDSGGQVGYDLTWFDAAGNVVGARLIDAAPKDPITEAQYNALIAQWSS